MLSVEHFYTEEELFLLEYCIQINILKKFQYQRNLFLKNVLFKYFYIHCFVRKIFFKFNFLTKIYFRLSTVQIFTSFNVLVNAVNADQYI